MSKLVRIKTGLSNVNLPNGNTYSGGAIVELTDDEYSQLASTALGDEVLDVSAEVAIGFANNDLRYIYIALTLSDIADGVLAATHTAGFAGTIRSVRFITDVPASTAAKLSTLTPKIGATPVTGGVLSLTTAAADTKGEVVNGTAVTAANVFAEGAVIALTASATTAFVEGSGYVEILASVN